MARSVNMVILLGNVGADPEIRNTPGGAQVANFRIACTESWKDQSGQKQERTEWVTLVAWRQLADIIQKYVHKGSKVHVVGKLQTRSWDDKATGTKRYTTEVLVNELTLLDGPQGHQGGQGGYSSAQGGGAPSGTGASDYPDFGAPPANVQPGQDDDLPF